jgi:hypothetical protein
MKNLKGAWGFPHTLRVQVLLPSHFVSQSGSLPSPKAKLWCGIWVIENKGI